MNELKRIRKPNATAQQIHLQTRSYVPGMFRYLCGSGTGKTDKRALRGEPQPPAVFYKTLAENPYRCCAMCLKQAVVKGALKVNVNEETHI